MKMLRVAILIALCLGAAPGVLWAQEADEKKHHGTERAVEAQASQDNEGRGGIFTRTGDWFATVGRSDERKKEILAARRAKRAERRADKAKGEHKTSGAGEEKKHRTGQGHADREKHGNGQSEHAKKRGDGHGQARRAEKHGDGHGPNKHDQKHDQKGDQKRGEGHGKAHQND